MTQWHILDVQVYNVKRELKSELLPTPEEHDMIEKHRDNNSHFQELSKHPLKTTYYVTYSEHMEHLPTFLETVTTSIVNASTDGNVSFIDTISKTCVVTTFTIVPSLGCMVSYGRTVFVSSEENPVIEDNTTVFCNAVIAWYCYRELSSQRSHVIDDVIQTVSKLHFVLKTYGEDSLKYLVSMEEAPVLVPLLKRYNMLKERN